MNFVDINRADKWEWEVNLKSFDFFDSFSTHINSLNAWLRLMQFGACPCMNVECESKNIILSQQPVIVAPKETRRKFKECRKFPHGTTKNKSLLASCCSSSLYVFSCIECINMIRAQQFSNFNLSHVASCKRRRFELIVNEQFLFGWFSKFFLGQVAIRWSQLETCMQVITNRASKIYAANESNYINHSNLFKNASLGTIEWDFWEEWMDCIVFVVKKSVLLRFNLEILF